jgi:hypothetical protein
MASIPPTTAFIGPSAIGSMRVSPQLRNSGRERCIPTRRRSTTTGRSRLKLRFSQTFSISRKEPVEQPLTLDNPPALTRDQIKPQW